MLVSFDNIYLFDIEDFEDTKGVLEAINLRRTDNTMAKRKENVNLRRTDNTMAKRKENVNLRRTDNTMAKKIRKKEKQRCTKHYTENKRSSNPSITKIR